MQEHLNRLQHYFNRIIECPQIKLILSSICTLIYYLFGAISEPVLIILVLILVDLLTGILKGIKIKLDYEGTLIKLNTLPRVCYVSIKTVRSKAMRNGLLKVIEYFIALFLANMISRMYSLQFFRTMVIYWVALTEFKSILENLYQLDIKVPHIIIVCIDSISKVFVIKTDKLKECIKETFKENIL